jgi:cytochrome c oxidase cbb3-type subunit 3
MSDFYSGFWDYYVAILTVVSILACGVLLKMQSKRRVKLAPGEAPSTTGHTWDGDLTEHQNPLPRWWIILFYLTIVYSVVYLVLFPGLGTQFKGWLKWSSTDQHATEVAAASAKYGPLYESFLKQDLLAVAADPRGRQMGERIFQNNCAQCHGVDARGSRGFPNLADAEWIYGAEPETIKASIAAGRQGVMPPMAAAVGGAEGAADVAHYVLSLSGSAHDSVRAARGKAAFAACAACHGAEGKGNPQLGAPNISNKIWTYGGSADAIIETITRGRTGVMPAHKGILSDAEIHLVAAYVTSLTGVPVSAATRPAPSR